MNVRVVRALRGCVRTLPSPKGLVIFSTLPRAYALGYYYFAPAGLGFCTIIPPCKLRTSSHKPFRLASRDKKKKSFTT
jgi:hypothetical protein